MLLEGLHTQVGCRAIDVMNQLDRKSQKHGGAGESKERHVLPELIKREGTLLGRNP